MIPLQEPYYYKYGACIEYNNNSYYLGESMSENIQLSASPYIFEEMPVYFWTSAQGASYGRTSFLGFNEGNPIVLFVADGNIDFYDLDDDGVPEIISSLSGQIPSTVDIFFWCKDSNYSLTKVSVNDYLKVLSVYYRDGIFTAYETEDGSPKEYIYENGSFKPAS